MKDEAKQTLGGRSIIWIKVSVVLEGDGDIQVAKVPSLSGPVFKI